MQKRDKGYVMPRVAGLNVLESPMSFCRKNVPIIAKNTTINGEEYRVFEGNCQIAENMTCRIIVKPDGFETDKGNVIAYRVTLMGFNMDAQKNLKKRTNKGLSVIGVASKR